jgi:hypothetical protein
MYVVLVFYNRVSVVLQSVRIIGQQLRDFSITGNILRYSLFIPNVFRNARFLLFLFIIFLIFLLDRVNANLFEDVDIGYS